MPRLGERKPLLERLFERITVSESGCWNWAGTNGNSPVIETGGRGGKAIQVKRVMYEMTYGPLTDQFRVWVTCGNSQCIAPEHLRAKATPPVEQVPLSPEQRFWANVVKTEACWVWIGGTNDDGYGKLRVNGKVVSAHRYSLILAGTPLPPRMMIDHTCRVRRCVRPEHLRLVTPRVNTLENSESLPAINAQKTHCKNGHEFTPENTRVKHQSTGRGRECVACITARAQQRAAVAALLAGEGDHA